MWIPAWLWKGYSRLYSAFGEETFGFSEAMHVLSLDDLRTRVILSRLRRAGYLVLFERKARMRRYRAIDVSLLAFSEGAGIRNFTFPQGRYAQLVLLWCRKLLSYYGKRMRSIVLYGSVARGAASSSSDIDFMLVVDGLERSYGKRINEIVWLELDPTLMGERTYLRQHGYGGQLSNVVYTPEESEAFRLLYLDIIHDGHILFDYQGHFAKIAARLRARLDETGAKRVILEGGGWYWDLKPDIQFGERLEL